MCEYKYNDNKEKFKLTCKLNKLYNRVIPLEDKKVVLCFHSV